MIYINNGKLLPILHPNYNDDRIFIKIKSTNDYNININHIIGNEPFNYDEIAKPSAKDIYNMDNLYLKEITDLIIEKAKQKKFEDYMYKVASDATMDTSWIKEMTEKDLNEVQEYEKYSKLYEEKFGKKVYIAEPSGTMGKTITAIKTCLEKNEDLLDSLLYPEDSHFEFYKKNGNDKTWWIDSADKIGEHLFSFDKKKIYNLFRDYPHELTNEEKEIFDKENPYWVDFLRIDNNLKVINQIIFQLVQYVKINCHL